jgi:hypothetical protein
MTGTEAAETNTVYRVSKRVLHGNALWTIKPPLKMENK